MLTNIEGGQHGGGVDACENLNEVDVVDNLEWHVDHVMKTYCQTVFVAPFGHVTSIYLVGFHGLF